MTVIRKMLITDSEFARLWKAGTPPLEIARQAGVSRSAVSHRARTIGLRPKGKKHKPLKCRCNNPDCLQVYFANPNPPIEPHRCECAA